MTQLWLPLLVIQSNPKVGDNLSSTNGQHINVHVDAVRPVWSTDASSIWGVAQAVKGLPWLLEGVGNSTWNYTTRPHIMNDTMDIKYFENHDLTMDVDGNMVSFRYKFRDFQGINIVLAPWEAILKIRCQTLRVL